MPTKKTRLDVLRHLIQNKTFDNQEDLLSNLSKEGFKIAQPTLSRDLRQLKVSKTYDKQGRYIYVLPSDANFHHVSSNKQPKERMTQSFGFLSLGFSGNIAVVRTLHGYANSLAAEIDDHLIPEILGTLAGDDTILLIMQEGADRNAVLKLMEEIIPGFE